MTGRGVHIERIGTLEELDRAADMWHALHTACADSSVFADHRWVRAWWGHFGPGKAQHTLVLHRGADPVGIVPLVLSRGLEIFPTRNSYIQMADDYRCFPKSRWRRLVPIRRLSFPLGIVSGNVRGGIVLPGEDPDLIDAVVNYVARISGQWDMASFDGVPARRGLENDLLGAAPRAGLGIGRRRFTRRLLRADLPDSMAAYLRGRTGHFRKRMPAECRKAVKAVAHFGELTFREYRGATIDAGMEALFTLEQRSWKVKDTRNRNLHVVLDDRSRAFHLDVARAFAATDDAQVMVMDVGGDPAMALYTLEFRGITTCLLTYRSERYGRLMSSAPLWRHFVDRSIARGLREIDFNGYTRNIKKWADDERGFVRLNLYNGHPYSRVLRAVDYGAGALAERYLRPARTKANTPRPGGTPAPS